MDVDTNPEPVQAARHQFQVTRIHWPTATSLCPAALHVLPSLAKTATLLKGYLDRERAGICCLGNAGAECTKMVGQ